MGIVQPQMVLTYTVPLGKFHLGKSIGLVLVGKTVLAMQEEKIAEAYLAQKK